MIILTEAQKGCESAKKKKNPPQYQYEQHNDVISIQLYTVTHTHKGPTICWNLQYGRDACLSIQLSSYS